MLRPSDTRYNWHNSKTYYFCDASYKAFDQNPAKYIKKKQHSLCPQKGRNPISRTFVFSSVLTVTEVSQRASMNNVCRSSLRAECRPGGPDPGDGSTIGIETPEEL